MPLQKVSDSEVFSTEGYRIRYDRSVLSYSVGSRYLTIPIEHLDGSNELRVCLSQTSPWMENGKPCDTDGTLNLPWLRALVSEALVFLGRKFSFDR